MVVDKSTGIITQVTNDAIVAGSKAFNPTGDTLVLELPLQGLSQTVSSGTQTSVIRLKSANNWNVAKAIAANCGGRAVALGLAFKLRNTVTVADNANVSDGFRAKTGIEERYARSTIQCSPGKAGAAYFMSNGEVSIGQFMAWVLESSNGFTEQLKAAYMAIADLNTTEDRFGSNNDKAVYSAEDNYLNLISRGIMPFSQPRLTFQRSGGTITTPEAGDPQCDVVYFPLTMDGPTGVTSSGFDIDELFGDPEWQFYLRPVFDSALYSSGSSSGTFAIDVSLVYRVEVPGDMVGQTAAKPLEGAVWRWLINAGTVQDGVAQTINGENIASHIAVGYPPVVYGEPGDPGVPVLNGTSYFFQEVEAGTAQYVKRRLIPPMLVPSDLNTSATYVKIASEDGKVTFPRGEWTQALGNESLIALNARARRVLLKNGTAHQREGVEYPLFSTTTVRATATSFVVYTDGAVTYGTTGAGGTPVDVTVATRGAETTVALGVGGLRNFLLAWADRSTNGFSGVQPRSDKDKRGLFVLATGGFRLPKLVWNGTGLAPVHVINRMSPYSEFASDICGCKHEETKPLVFDKSSPAIDKGKTMTSGFVVTALPK